MTSIPDVNSIVIGLQSDETQARKLAAFSLQGALSKDAQFADLFAGAGGLPILRRLILDERGNTLAYALGSFTQLLQQGIGWGQVEKSIVSLALDLVVSRSVINVLRNALSLLVLVVTRVPPDEPLDLYASMPPSSHSFDYDSLRSTLKDHPTFLECLVERLEAADHALCANVLQLINGLLRDTLNINSENEWPVFFKQLQDVGVLVAVEQIMRGDAVSHLVQHLIDFQNLVRALYKQWTTIPVQMDLTMHRTALLAVHHSSLSPSPSTRRRPSSALKDMPEAEDIANGGQATWQRLGFTTEEPAEDFDALKLLGLVDLTDYVRGSNDAFEKELLEQSILPAEERCPVARVSLCVTSILCDHFGVTDRNNTITHLTNGQIDRDELVERQLRPNMMRWSAIHMSAVNLFVRLWTSARALTSEFDKIGALVRTLVVDTLQDTSRRDPIDPLLDMLNNATLAQVRDMQASFLEATSQAAWGLDLGQLRQRFRDEATRFMQEQRIRCLLIGAWFPVVVASAQVPQSVQSSEHAPSVTTSPDSTRTHVSVHSWCFVRLSSGRRHLHHSLYTARSSVDPELSEMRNRIDVTSIKSVVSNVSIVEWDHVSGRQNRTEADSTTSSLLHGTHGAESGVTGSALTTLHVVGTPKRAKGVSASPTPSAGVRSDTTLLELHTTDSSLASEFLDGLLMLLNQKPITADTDKMIRVIENWSLRARVMNLDEHDAEARRLKGGDGIKVPSRDGIGTDFYYRMGEEVA